MSGSLAADAPTTATAVGSPQSRNRSPRLMRSASPAVPARIDSIAANDVPPTPPTSIPPTPGRRGGTGTLRGTPPPVSFAIPATGDDLVGRRRAPPAPVRRAGP